MICCRNITKCYGATTVVQGLDLIVPLGSICGLLGHHQAGKTTTLHMMAGLVTPTFGEIIINGMDISSDWGLKRVGYVQFSPQTNEGLTARQNVVVAARTRGIGRQTAERRASELLHQLQLAPERWSYAARERLGVGIACALIDAPDILLLDEPTGSMAIEGRRWFWRVIKDLARVGLTVVMAIHDPDDAMQCTMVARLHFGRLVYVGPPNVQVCARVQV